MFASNTSQVSSAANYIEDVFSTYLYTGNGSTQTITNGIDLAAKGGLVWTKSRSNSTTNNSFYDTLRGATNPLSSNNTLAPGTIANTLTGFNADGFSVGSATGVWATNANTQTYTSWTFRKQPKFFDVVTYTGTGSTRTVSHSLGSVPGCIIIKRTDTTDDWVVYHKDLVSSVPAAGYSLYLNLTNSVARTSTTMNDTNPTATVFTVGSAASTNASGGTYVAYLFADNAGGFGLTGTDNVITCGTTSASSNGQTNLGYEPQLVLLKDPSNVGNWYMFDNMRGVPTGGNDAVLFPNTSGAENSSADYITFNATGFTTTLTSYIYIAIRRGPMKTPTSGTSVFAPVTITGTGASRTVTTPGFPVDLAISKVRNTTFGWSWEDRLRGAKAELMSNNTDVEYSYSDGLTGFDNMLGYFLGADASIGRWNYPGGYNYEEYALRRAPQFFDEVCYTGTGSGTTVAHNLGVAPELIITKRRDSTSSWLTYENITSSGFDRIALNFNSPAASYSYASGAGLEAQPTASNIYIDATFLSGATYVAYLFATCPGVSKVGSYTGTGATQTISCGFTGGARFVLIKRTDSTGDWSVWDTDRGMVSGTDPSLLLNSTAAEVNANSIYTTTGGFQIVSTAAGINASGGTYIFLAIA